MGGRYEVFPDGDEWGWRLITDDGEGDKNEQGFALRNDAIAAAREDRGDVREEIFSKTEEGEFESLGVITRSRGPESLVLMRPDGSMYGEIDHEIREGGEPQTVTLDPAGETGETQVIE